MTTLVSYRPPSLWGCGARAGFVAARRTHREPRHPRQLGCRHVAVSHRPPQDSQLARHPRTCRSDSNNRAAAAHSILHILGFVKLVEKHD